MSLTIEAFRGWLATGERGLSSESIVEHLTGFPLKGRIWASRIDHPLDPSDFRRCERLLREVPLARLAFGEMRTASAAWARLVDAWDELVALSEEECPGQIDAYRPEGSAPRLNHEMSRILAGGVECETCKGTGRGAECPKCKGAGRRSGGRCRARGCFRGADLCKPCHGNGYTVPVVQP